MSNELKEDFLHYLWKYQLFNTQELKVLNGECIQIITTGIQNFDSGPDFFNAKIKIADTLWAGNVEIHINSSDWIKHSHQKDKAYNNVILHVVYNYNKPIFDANGNEIPTLALKDYIDEILVNRYKELLKSKDWIPCGKQFQMVDDFTVKSWLSRLAVERLERKSEEIEISLKQNNNDWEETFYQYLFKYFGLKVNDLPFYQLAVNTPLKIAEKHNNVLSIEALYYGQAGFLNNNIDVKYYKELQKEYEFLRAKFSLENLEVSLWKFMRLRPRNFPTIRISQLANLLSNHPRLFSKIIEVERIQEIYNLFKVEASPYWNKHYRFGDEKGDDKIKALGKTTIDSIIINVIVPFTFVYGKAKSTQKLIDKSIFLLELVKPEKNTILKNWEKLGLKASNSFQTQSLLELKNNYCSEKKCLNCSIGAKILQQ